MIQAKIRKQYAAMPDSAGFSLDLEFRAASGVTVLFGSSGSGKTLTLDSIAGFVRPDEGRILLDDQILFDGASGVHLPPRARHCGYVFQNYALFPHMTLRQNLEFAVERAPRLGRPRLRLPRPPPRHRRHRPGRGLRHRHPPQVRPDRRRPHGRHDRLGVAARRPRARLTGAQSPCSSVSALASRGCKPPDWSPF